MSMKMRLSQQSRTGAPMLLWWHVYFRSKFQKLRKLAQEARGMEMASVGLAPIESLDKYKEVVKDSYELIDTIDENKIQKIKSLKRFVSTKEFIVGILAGLISGYLLHLFIASPTS